MTLRIEIVSDVISPWCYVCKRRLEKALALLGDAQPPEALAAAIREAATSP